MGEVAECCSVDFSVVSRHLTMLAKAGVLEADKQGRSITYRLKMSVLEEALLGFAGAFGLQMQRAPEKSSRPTSVVQPQEKP